MLFDSENKEEKKLQNQSFIEKKSKFVIYKNKIMYGDESSHSGAASFLKVVLVLALVGGLSYLIYWVVTKDKTTTPGPTTPQGTTLETTTTKESENPPPVDNGNTTTVSAPSDSGLGPGGIVGISLGSIVVLVLIAFGVYLKNRNERDRYIKDLYDDAFEEVDLLTILREGKDRKGASPAQLRVAIRNLSNRLNSVAKSERGEIKK